MIAWAILVLFAALFIVAMLGYGIGATESYKNGFEAGVEHERLKSIDKLEPEGR